MIRHGDVQLIRVNSIPSDVTKLKRKELAFGEVTGHAHRVEDLAGDLFQTKDGLLYLKVEKLSHLGHEEHKTITLEPDCYFVGIKRQYTPDGWEEVHD